MGLEQLITDCGKGRRQAQEMLYNRYAQTLFSVSLKYSRNYAEAEDNLQDAFITILDKVSQYGNKGSFEGWLKRIVVNTALQRYRKQDVFEIVNGGQIEDVEVEADSDQVPMDFLLKIIQELPDRYRLVFNLYVLDGHSHREIAGMINVSEGTSKSNLARARAILKEKIEVYSAPNDLQSSTQ